MPTHSLLPEARRKAIEAAFDDALAEVRAAGDVALLQECRTIFRQRVPLNLRAYVAAALALKCAGTMKTQDRFGKRTMDTRDTRGRGDHRKEASVDPSSKKAEKPKKQSSTRDDATVPDREPRAIRENRYKGEGLTIFVSAGRRQRFYARIAIKLLLDIPGVADEQIGDIRTMDNYSFIVIDPVIEDMVITALEGYDFKGRILAANRARKRGEPATTSDESEYSESFETETDVDESGLPELEEFGAGTIEPETDDYPNDGGSDNDEGAGSTENV